MVFEMKISVRWEFSKHMEILAFTDPHTQKYRWETAIHQTQVDTGSWDKSISGIAHPGENKNTKGRLCGRWTFREKTKK